MSNCQENNGLKALGAKISQIRGERSQDKFAIQAQVSRSSLVKAEAGENVQSQVLEKILNECGHSLREIFPDEAVEDAEYSTLLASVPDEKKVAAKEAVRALLKGFAT